MPDVTLNGSKLDLVSVQTYLGVIIDDNCKDNNDLYRQTKAIDARSNVLVKKFAMCNTDVKAKLFNTYYSTFYCSALWCYFDTMSFKRLQSSFNNMFTDTFRIQH